MQRLVADCTAHRKVSFGVTSYRPIQAKSAAADVGARIDGVHQNVWHSIEF